jgi:hypothetical protein
MAVAARRGSGAGRSIDDRPGPRLLSAFGAAVAATTLAAALVLVIRRMQVPFDTSGAPSVAAAIVGIVLVASVDVASSFGSRRFGWLPRWVVRLGLALALAATLPSPASLIASPPPPMRLAATAVAVIAAAVVLLAPAASPRGPSPAAPARRRQTDRGRRRDRPGDSPRRQEQETERRPETPLIATAIDRPELPVPAHDPESTAVAAVEPPPAGGVLQQRFERYLLPDERVECLRGTLHLTVVAGSRLATGHVGFCPPFHQIPFVEAGTRCEEVEATILAAEVLPWGTRIECRLDEPADETILIPIDFLARAPLPSADSPLPSPFR